eukprot:1106323-Pleurochrysis_carterae.AAC.1
MLCFYDLVTKYLELYYLRNATAAEVQNYFKTFLADNHRYHSGRVVTWLTVQRKEARRCSSQVSHPLQIHRALQPADSSC